MVFTVTIFCVLHLGYRQENHFRSPVINSSHLGSELSKSQLPADDKVKIMEMFSDMSLCQSFVEQTKGIELASIEALPGKFISYHCTYERPGPSYAVIRYYNGRIVNKIIPGAE
jgi:hypothetical protein